MILTDEGRVSQLDGREWHKRLSQMCYDHADVRPSWVGAHYPITTDSHLVPLCGWAQIHYLFYQTLLEDFVEKPGSVLDLGCGAGNTTQFLARYCHSVVGLDMDPAAIQFAHDHNSQPNVHYVEGTFPFTDGATTSGFHHVICVEVLEHIPYERQWAFLDACLVALRPGGSVLLTTPNEEVAAPPHIGILTSARIVEFRRRYEGRYQLDYLQTRPSGMTPRDYDPRRGSFPSSHYRIVLWP